MFAFEYPENNTLAFSYTENPRKHFMYIIRNNRIAYSLELDNAPRLSLSGHGLLAVTTSCTKLFNLNEKQVLKPQMEIQGSWVFADSGNELFTIAGQKNPVKNQESGMNLQGLIARNSETGKVRLINAKLNVNPVDLYLSANGDRWAAIDRKHKQIFFGENNQIAGKYAWNKGLLGSMPDNLVFDPDNRRIYVQHRFYKFYMISRIGFDGSIKSLKEERPIFAPPVHFNNYWMLAIETKKELHKSMAHRSITHLYFLNPDTMQIEGKVHNNPIPVSTNTLLYPLSNGKLAIFRKMKLPVFWDRNSGEIIEEKAIKSKKQKSIEKEFLCLALDFIKNINIYDHYKEYMKEYEAAAGEELSYATFEDCLHMGMLPVFAGDTHFFIGLAPIYNAEFEQWPVVEIDEEWGYTIKKIHAPANRDFSLFTDREVVITEEKAWNLFTSLWPGSPITPIKAACIIIDQHSRQNSPLYPFIEAIARGTEDTMYNVLINAGNALEKAGDQSVTLCCYYNVLVGAEYDSEWNETALDGLLRCANMVGSRSFKTYIGLVLKRKFNY